MIEGGVPSKFPIPWGNSANPSYIRDVPTASQIGVQAGAASLTDGFVPDNFIPAGGGGVPPFGQDFNGILKQITQWLIWAQAGAPIQYDSAFQALIGGYPNNAVVFSATTPGKVWLCTVDNNASNPDTGGANWTDISPNRAAGGGLNGTYPNPGVNPGAGMFAGMIFFWPSQTLPAGVLACNGAAVSRTTYSAILAVAAPLGTILPPFGVGNGTTTFNLPNYNGVFLRGFDPSGAVDPGHAFGTQQAHALQSHNHLNGMTGSTGTDNPFVYVPTTTGVPGLSSKRAAPSNIAPNIQGTTSVGATGPQAVGAFAAETRPVNSNGYWVIKT